MTWRGSDGYGQPTMVALAGVLLSATAVAQAEGGSPWEVRFRAGVAVRSGVQTDRGPGLGYSGVTPNDLSLQAWGWPLLEGRLGLFGSVHREGFGLYDGGARVLEGTLWRAAVGPTGRLTLGAFTIEPGLAWAWHQLPTFGSTAAPRFFPAQRHALLAMARVTAALGPVVLEVRGEVPVSLSVLVEGGGVARASGAAAGVAVRYPLATLGPVRVGALLDASWQADEVLAGADVRALQRLWRLGAAVDLRGAPAAPVVRPATLRVTVVHALSGAPLPGAALRLASSGGAVPLLPDATGAFVATGLSPGPLQVEATLAGFAPARGFGEAKAGVELALTVALTPEAPTTGALQVRAVEQGTQKPLAGALVEAAGQAVPTAEDGAVSLSGLPPGPVPVKVSRAGFTPAEEVVSIEAGTTAELSVALVPEAKRLPATVSGHVRNKRGGKPVAATLTLVEAKMTLTAGADGEFSVSVPGGAFTVRISARGFVTQTKKVIVKDGDQAILNVDLSPR